MGLWALWAAALVAGAGAEVYTYPSSVTWQFSDYEAAFGPAVSDHLTGYLVTPESESNEEGCNAWSGVAPANISTPIALVRQGGCFFVNKVVRAQEAGCVAVIVYNDENNKLVTMGDPGNGSLAHIPSVYIGLSDADTILAQMGEAGSGGLRAALDSNYWGFFDEINSTVLLVTVALIAAIVCFRCCAIRYRRTRFMRAGGGGLVAYAVMEGEQGPGTFPEGQVSRLRELVIDQRHQGMCCICIDDYTPGDTCKVLPCRHVFHAACIVPWLVSQQNVCPLCKSEVDIDTAGYDASEPILSSSADSQRFEDFTAANEANEATQANQGEGAGFLDADQQTPLL